MTFDINANFDGAVCTMKSCPRPPLDDEALRRLADYLWGSRVEAGAAIQAAVRQAARRHRMNYSDLWNEVHRLACLQAPGR
jgi:hypothetical protein